MVEVVQAMVEELEELEVEPVVVVLRKVVELTEAEVPELEVATEAEVPGGLIEVVQPELVVQVQARLPEVLVEGLVDPAEEEGVELAVALLLAEGVLM